MELNSAHEICSQRVTSVLEEYVTLRLSYNPVYLHPPRSLPRAPSLFAFLLIRQNL